MKDFALIDSWVHEGFKLILDDVELGREAFLAQASALAHKLSQQGIGPGKTVVVKMEKSIEQIIAVASVFESGAILVPVDSDIPEERFKQICNQCSAELVIDDTRFRELTELPTTPQNAGPLCKYPDDDIALIVFTSGSTGTPKGVCHTRKSVCAILNLVPKYIRENDINIKAVVGSTSLGFLSCFFFDIGVSFTFGKPLVIVPEKEKTSTGYLDTLLANYPGALIFMTPSKYSEFSKSKAFRERIAKSGMLILAGEKTSDALRRELVEAYSSDVVIVDFYGSTEVGLPSCTNIKTHTNDFFNELIICNDDGIPVAPSERGQILVLAQNIFAGYLGDDAQYVDIDGRHYFPTGDIGYWDDCGRLHVEGRNDRQVEIHGLRTELDEIEHYVREVPGVMQAAVVFDEESHRVGAFYTADEPISRSIFLETLKKHLPYQAIPTILRHVDAISLNSRGKTDYPRLTEMAFAVSAESEGANSENAAGALDNTLSEEPADEKLHVLIKCATRVLASNAVRTNDYLPALGLDSLASIELNSLLEEEGFRVATQDVFLCSTVSELAQKMQPVACGKGKPCVEKKESYPLVNGMHKYIATSQLTGNEAGPLFWVEDSFIVRKAFTEEEWRARIELIQKRHPILRAIFSFGGPTGLMYTISDEPIATVKYFDLQDLATSSQATAGEVPCISPAQAQHIDAFEQQYKHLQNPGDPSESVTFALFRIDSLHSVVYLRISHILGDGMSLVVLKEELCADILSEQEDAFYTYMTWFDNCVNKDEAIGFFKEYLDGVTFPFLPRGTQAADGMPVMMHMQNANMQTYSIDFGPANPTDQAHTKLGSTPFVRVIYAYGKALLRTFGLDALAFYMVSSGRNVPVANMQDIVGGFATRMPVVVRAEETLKEFYARLYEAESHLCLTPEELWIGVYGSQPAFELGNIPDFVSELFPDKTDGCIVGDYHGTFIGDSGQNCYLLEQDGSIVLRITCDEARVDPLAFDVLLKNLREEAK